jgi:hypothetical protein
MSKKHKHTIKPTLSAAPAEEYRPSDNADKYNIPDPRYAYKILAFRNDYIALQEEVTRYLNDGWSLAGGVNTSIHADAYASVTLFAQAVYKIS